MAKILIIKSLHKMNKYNKEKDKVFRRNIQRKHIHLIHKNTKKDTNTTKINKVNHQNQSQRQKLMSNSYTTLETKVKQKS